MATCLNGHSALPPRAERGRLAGVERDPGPARTWGGRGAPLAHARRCAQTLPARASPPLSVSLSLPALQSPLCPSSERSLPHMVVPPPRARRGRGHGAAAGLSTRARTAAWARGGGVRPAEGEGAGHCWTAALLQPACGLRGAEAMALPGSQPGRTRLALCRCCFPLAAAALLFLPPPPAAAASYRAGTEAGTQQMLPLLWRTGWGSLHKARSEEEVAAAHAG